MIKQPTVHHYILSYDAENELWYHDVEMEREKFPDGATLNIETGVSSWGYLGDGQYEPNEEELNYQITQAVRILNRDGTEVPFPEDDFQYIETIMPPPDDETDRTHIPYPPI